MQFHVKYFLISRFFCLARCVFVDEFESAFCLHFSEHSDLVEAMNDESLESNLWSFELEMQALENKLMTFLATRKFAYPKFALCSTPKIKTIFCYRDIENLNKWISLLFPHVQKLVVKREQQILITGKLY